MKLRLSLLAFAALAASTALVASTRLASAAYTSKQIAAESAKANTFFERAFDDGVARSPMTLTQLGQKKDNDKWDDFSEQAQLENWIRNTARHVAMLYGRFPVASLQVVVAPTPRGSGPVPWAYVARGGGPAVHLFINPRARQTNSSATGV